jgi:glycerophosphoryl diester phosphodiesterase
MTLASWAAMIEPLPSRPRRVGHKGAAHIEPGNTLASFDAALQHGVDMIELDVLSEHPDGSGRLLVAHDYEDMRSRSPLELERALEHLAAERFAGIDLDVDVKLPGYELRVLAALRERELVPRTLISGMFPAALARIRAAEPALRLGWSVPRVRRDYTTDMLTAIPALAMLTGYRATLPRRARIALRAGRFDAIMAHWRVVTPALVRAVAEGGGELYVWTVDDARMIAKLTDMGVDGIITNDPRLFSRTGS